MFLNGIGMIEFGGTGEVRWSGGPTGPGLKSGEPERVKVQWYM